MTKIEKVSTKDWYQNLSGIRFLFSALGHARFLREFVFGSLFCSQSCFMRL